MSVAPGRILATLTDATVLMVRAYQTPYDAVLHAHALLYGAGARVLRVALNDVDMWKGGCGFGYYYRYGYGYGSDSARNSDRHEQT